MGPVRQSRHRPEEPRRGEGPREGREAPRPAVVRDARRSRRERAGAARAALGEGAPPRTDDAGRAAAGARGAKYGRGRCAETAGRGVTVDAAGGGAGAPGHGASPATASARPACRARPLAVVVEVARGEVAAVTTRRRPVTTVPPWRCGASPPRPRERTCERKPEHPRTHVGLSVDGSPDELPFRKPGRCPDGGPLEAARL